MYHFSWTNTEKLFTRHIRKQLLQKHKLSKAPNDFDVEHSLEYSEGYKHVDITIESAKLYLELDGSQHAFSTKQMLADDDRDKHSLKAGYTTKRIINA